MNEMIKKWRKEANMTQEELANHLFLTPQAVSLLENGKRTLQHEVLQDIAKVFQKEVIFYIQDEPFIKEITDKESLDKIKAEITGRGLICIDDEDIDKIVSLGGKTYYTKSNGIILDEVIQGAFKHFQKRDIDLQDAKGILFFVDGATNFTFDDLDKISQVVHQDIQEDAFIITGCHINNEEKRGYTVRLLATGF